MLCGGSSNQSGQLQFMLTQYNANGSLDTGFGDNGAVFTNVGNAGSAMLSMTQVVDQTLFATGSAGGDVPLVKYNEDGTLENDFGNAGVVLTDMEASDTGSEILLQDDGKILLIGSTAVPGNPVDGMISRFNADGSLDMTFNGTGWLNFGLSQFFDRPSDVVLLPNGRILVVGGVANDLSELEIFALRLMPDGAFDTSFGTDGVARYHIGVGNDLASEVIVQPDGKAIIGGTVNNGNDYDFCLIRINEDGFLDTDFGDSGVVITDIAAGETSSAQWHYNRTGNLLLVVRQGSVIFLKTMWSLSVTTQASTHLYLKGKRTQQYRFFRIRQQL